MECRERAMGEYRWRRERGMSRDEARDMWRNGRRSHVGGTSRKEVMMDKDAQKSANEEMDRLRREARENIAKGEAWTCVCGKVVVNSFACPVCGLTVIGSDMKRAEQERLAKEHVVRLNPGMVIRKAEDERPKIRMEIPADSGWTVEQQGSDIELVMVDEDGNPVGDHDAGAGEGEGGVVVARAGAEEGGYTHRETALTSDADFDPRDAAYEIVDAPGEVTLPLEEPTPEDVKAYEKMYRGEADYIKRAIYIMMLVALTIAIACIGGLIIGKAVYGV